MILILKARMYLDMDNYFLMYMQYIVLIYYIHCLVDGSDSDSKVVMVVVTKTAKPRYI